VASLPADRIRRAAAWLPDLGVTEVNDAEVTTDGRSLHVRRGPEHTDGMTPTWYIAEPGIAGLPLCLPYQAATGTADFTVEPDNVSGTVSLTGPPGGHTYRAEITGVRHHSEPASSGAEPGMPEPDLSWLDAEAAALRRRLSSPELAGTRQLPGSLENWRLRLDEDADRIASVTAGTRLYGLLARFLLDHGAIEDALVASELGRARAFADLLAAPAGDREPRGAPRFSRMILRQVTAGQRQAGPHSFCSAPQCRTERLKAAERLTAITSGAGRCPALPSGSVPRPEVTHAAAPAARRAARRLTGAAPGPADKSTRSRCTPSPARPFA
jgi:hypothetical protein